MSENPYDILIAGGGCAGLTLADRLAGLRLGRPLRLLVVEPNAEPKYDKTWCFWSKEPERHAPYLHKEWPEIAFASEGRKKAQLVSPYRYCCVRNDDYLGSLRARLGALPNVDFRQGRAVATEDAGRGASLLCEGGERYFGRWAFDSVPRPVDLDSQPGIIWLWQHFKGYVVRTSTPAFEPGVMTLMDFDVPQHGETRFFYVLPFSETEALVEYTVFSETPLHEEEYDPHLEAYLSGKLGLEEYEVTHEEVGKIPMTNYRFPAQEGERVFRIGTAGGLTKPTTGYTFRRIQQDADRIAADFAKHGRPMPRPERSRRFAFYDDLLLWIVKNRGGRVSKIMQRLFYGNDFRLILKFLDEETGLWEDARIFARLPWADFLRALFSYYVLKRP